MTELEQSLYDENKTDIEMLAIMSELPEEYIVQVLAGLVQKEAERMATDKQFAEDYDKTGADALSDVEMKYLQGLAERGGPFNDDELSFLARRAGPDAAGHSYEDEDDWSDDVADAYAEHLRNYIYKYKPAARKIDANIDPNEQHIGIMAQDLEQVNPACIKTTPDGYKTVDTARLALMNAGAIGDVARRLNALEERLDGRQ